MTHGPGIRSGRFASKENLPNFIENFKLLTFTIMSKEVIQNHGMTHAQVEDLRIAQAQGDTIKSFTGNNAGDHIHDEVFKSLYRDYQVPYHELGHYHVAMESRQWDTAGATPTRVSVPSVQKFTTAAFKQMMD